MPFFRRRPPFALMVINGALCTIAILVFARLSYGLVLPAMRDGLGLSNTQAANLSTVNALGYLLLVMVAGVFAARFGGKTSVVLGLMLVTGGFFGLAHASDFVPILLLMLVLGMGTAFGYTPLISLLANTFPHRRGAVIGFANSGVGLGMLLVGLIVPAMTERSADQGWRDVWLLFAAGGLGVLVMSMLILRNPLDRSATARPKVRAKDLPVFRNPHVITVGLVYGVQGLTYIVQTTFMYSYALESGVPALTTGHLVSMMGIMSVFTGPLWGGLADRLGYSNSLVLAMTLSLVGTALPVLWPVQPMFVAHFLILGLCISGLFTSILAASTETVAPHQAAVAVSFVTLFYAVGQLIGPAAASLIIEWSGGFRATFAATSVVLALGVYLGHRSRRYQQMPPQTCAGLAD